MNQMKAHITNYLYSGTMLGCFIDSDKPPEDFFGNRRVGIPDGLY